MKIACIQLRATADKAANGKRAFALIDEALAKKAQFILLPEMFLFRSRASLSFLKENIAEMLDGPTLRALAGIAKKARVFLLAGSIHEKRPGQEKLFNTSVLMDSNGRQAAIYRKTHLFEANINGQHIKEAKIFSAGKKSAMAVVGEFQMGMSICYDLRFAELYLKYKRRGAEILCVPSAFTTRTGAAHWESLLRARAIEARAYVLAPNQIGSDGSVVEAYGHSLIVSPWGEVLADAGRYQEKILLADVSKQALRETKKALPL